MRNPQNPTVGIDDLAAYIPSLYLPIATLAEARNIEYAKLNKGLGLEAMAVPDVGEDAATMMANAVRELIDRNQLDPRRIGRIYLGTESALDGAKPTATYALQMLTDYYAPHYGPDAFLHCDVVDLTFACIGAVDAMQNSLDWLRTNPEELAIVVAADNAKYELASTGEYTQGAGAVAVLLSAQPRLLAVDSKWGVATRPVYDFYKPLRRVDKADLIKEVLQLANRNHVDVPALVADLRTRLSHEGVVASNEETLYLHKETPVFDGPYSNACYQQRIREALDHYQAQHEDFSGATQWDKLIFHLPYAYQARRMFGEIFWREQVRGPQAELLREQCGQAPPRKEDFEDQAAFEQAQMGFWRMVSKTPLYREFVAQRIAPGERASSLVGNIYTGSIFLSLMSTLENASDLAPGQQFGFFAYGSGSKSKVFTATLCSGWAERVARFGLMERLQKRQAIDYPTYEALHRGIQREPVGKSAHIFRTQTLDAAGVRSYTCGDLV
ncbi:MAG: hydroxymethylglutaryl-CoA synthase family protein [Bacteroidetes bacterium]|nr:MAG: hydroxymethylglutaryl-CoA synthase family protein [Bacteroidota bacterium]